MRIQVKVDKNQVLYMNYGKSRIVRIQYAQTAKYMEDPKTKNSQKKIKCPNSQGRALKHCQDRRIVQEGSTLTQNSYYSKHSKSDT